MMTIKWRQWYEQLWNRWLLLFPGRGIHYEFGPEYEEYSAKKTAGILGETHIKPLSELFTEEQMKSLPIDNKVGENYFGQMTN